MKNDKLGGKLLSSGGYGCIFKPALRCFGKNTRDKNKISKLMTIKHAEEEYNEIIEIKKKIDNIPNYKKYFLIDNCSICSPEKLTKNDLKNYNECTALPKDDITLKNINQSLNKLKLINIPYGGITVEQFILENKSYKKLIKWNNCLISLLKEGIIPMNNNNIFHSDIKDSNILVDESNIDMETRLIDWSLTVEYIPKSKCKFPNNWRNRPLQFNVPFSILLFTDFFITEYTEFLKEDHSVTKERLEEFVPEYLKKWQIKRGKGHYSYINNIFYMIFSKKLTNMTISQIKNEIEENYTKKYIKNYLINVLLHFTYFKPNGLLNMRIYLDEIFIKIIDIWGFIITYLPLFELLYENYDELSKNQMELFFKLREIFLKYLYEPRVKPIDINDLENDLVSINNFIQNEFKNSRSLSRETSSKLFSEAKGLAKKTTKYSIRLKKYKNKSSLKTTIKNRK